MSLNYFQLRNHFFFPSAGNLKAAFVSLDQKLQGVLAMRMCPEPVRKGYAMLTAFLAKQVEVGMLWFGPYLLSSFYPCCSISLGLICVPVLKSGFFLLYVFYSNLSRAMCAQLPTSDSSASDSAGSGAGGGFSGIASRVSGMLSKCSIM
jgi:hypothetical protein